MSLGIYPYSDADIPAIEEFNGRLGAIGSEYSFPRRPSDLMPQGPGVGPIRHDLFLAKEDAIMRGGYALKREAMLIQGEAEAVCNLQIPLSEALIDRAYSNVGAAMVFDATRRSKLIYCLGMGSAQRPLPQLLAKLRWRIEHVPFHFRVLSAKNFLREIRFLRSRRMVAVVADGLRFTGLGSLGVAGWSAAAALFSESTDDLAVEDLLAFDARVDRLQDELRGQYPLFCDRTHAALNQKFPPGDVRLNRLIVTRAGTMIGWLLLTCTPLKNHKQFGNMKLGCIADGLCDSADAEVLVRVAVEWLKERDVDLIVSNQCHGPWLRALRSNLFLEGPSNFVLAMSPALATRAPALEDCYFNRGDGDGPINL